MIQPKSNIVILDRRRRAGNKSCRIVSVNPGQTGVVTSGVELIQRLDCGADPDTPWIASEVCAWPAGRGSGQVVLPYHPAGIFE